VGRWGKNTREQRPARGHTTTFPARSAYERKEFKKPKKKKQGTVKKPGGRLRKASKTKEKNEGSKYSL